MRIILGSSSPWRRKLMVALGQPFEVMDPEVDEKSIRSGSPQVLTMKLALAKSRALREKLTGDYILITSDLVVVCNGLIREKPENAVQARQFLESYRTASAQVVLTLVGYRPAVVRGVESEVVILDNAEIWFRNLTDQAIEWLITAGKVFTGAGAIAAADPDFREFIARVTSWDTAVGLPMEKTKALIRDLES